MVKREQRVASHLCCQSLYNHIPGSRKIQSLIPVFSVDGSVLSVPNDYSRTLTITAHKCLPDLFTNQYPREASHRPSPRGWLMKYCCTGRLQSFDQHVLFSCTSGDTLSYGTSLWRQDEFLMLPVCCGTWACCVFVFRLVASYSRMLGNKATGSKYA